MGWAPLLDGVLAEQARGAVIDIARAIAAGEGDPAAVTDRALFWAYVAGAFDDVWIADAYDVAVSELVATSAQYFTGLSLYGGVASLGFTIAHISEAGVADKSLAVIDDMIALGLEKPWAGNYDLISGLAGIGVYLLERCGVPSARAALERVVDQLIATSVLEGPGRAWLTGPELLPPSQRKRYPDGNYNCGVAHGVPGVIAFLARAAEVGIPRAGAAALEASHWLAAQYLPDDPHGHYPSTIERDRRAPLRGTRAAWCYGDPGVAITTFGAARRLGQSTEPALALARAAAVRPFETSMITDAALCHGATGVAHIYNRMYQASGDPVLRDGARAWFGHALQLRGNPTGVAGFAANVNPPGEPTAWGPSTNFLEGAIGVALALLAATREDEPIWDRTLQCDL